MRLLEILAGIKIDSIIAKIGQTKMDLLEIIIFSLKLFALISLIAVASSYALYKFKSSSRVEPYLRPTIISENKIQIEVEQKIAKELRQENSRFVIMNKAELQPAEKRMLFNKPNEKLLRQQSANGFNIYNYYSSSSFEPMHKIKL
ncbi:MAG: hypothetical protein ACYDA4_01135 [Ignavibacteriaceae bacterium]